MKVRTLGDPVLKERARPVTAFDDKLQRLASQMAETMHREDGVGLAATQVGVLSRVIVWRDPDTDESVQVFVNPEITECTDDCSTAAEGCLSLPGVSVEVTRSDEVTVRADDVYGSRLEMRLTGYPARIVQHEVDHLDGFLILDRASPEERRRALKEWHEQKLAADS